MSFTDTYTQRFGLRILRQGDDLSEDDYKFGRADRQLLDGLLTYATESHRHTGGDRTLTTAAPTVTLASTGGTLPANRVAFYRVALVDERSQEYGASSIVAVPTPLQIAVPNPPTITATAGGALQPGDYLYLLTAYSGSTGYETLASRPVRGTLANANTWTITVPVPPQGATGWNLYRKGPTDAEALFLTTFTTATTTYADTGSVTANRLRPLPIANTTSATSSVQVALSDALPAGYSVKIYRTFTQNDWASSLLVWTPTMPYLDVGQATTAGSPLNRSTAVGGAPKIDLVTETTGVLPPVMLTSEALANFAFPGPLAVTTTPWQWVCEFDRALIVSARATLARGSTPAATPVIVQMRIKRAGGTWATFNGFAAPITVPVGSSIGSLITIDPTAEDAVAELAAGDSLTMAITQTGGGATPTDSDLSVVVNLLVRHGSTTSYEWAT